MINGERMFGTSIALLIFKALCIQLILIKPQRWRDSAHLTGRETKAEKFTYLAGHQRKPILENFDWDSRVASSE